MIFSDVFTPVQVSFSRVVMFTVLGSYLVVRFVFTERMHIDLYCVDNIFFENISITIRLQLTDGQESMLSETSLDEKLDAHNLVDIAVEVGRVNDFFA